MKVFQKMSLCAAALVLSGAALVGANHAKESVAVKAEEITYVDTEVTQLQVRAAVGATDYRILVFFDSAWSNDGAENNIPVAAPVLSDLNTNDSIHFVFRDGTSKTLGDLYSSDVYFNKLWGDNAWATNPLGSYLGDNVEDLVRVTFDKGCEFPKQGSTDTRYRLSSGFSCMNMNGLNGSNIIQFNQAGGTLSKLTKLGDITLIGTSDPGRVDDAEPAKRFWINAIGTDWADNGYNIAIGRNTNLALNFASTIKFDGKIITEDSTDRRYGLVGADSGCAVLYKWAREGEHMSFMARDIADSRTVSKIVIPEGTQLPAACTAQGGYAYDIKYYEVDSTYVFNNYGTNSWDYYLDEVSGSNVAYSQATVFNWAKFGDGNVWGMFKVEGVDKAVSNISAVDTYVSRTAIKNTKLGSRILVNGQPFSTVMYNNIGVGGHTAQDMSIHFNVEIATVDTWKTLIIPEDTLFLSAAAYGLGADGVAPRWIRLSKPMVVVNTNSGWQLATVENADVMYSFMYEGNQSLNGGSKNGVDFAFYVPGLAPEVKTGDSNALSVRGTDIGNQILTAADTAGHILINGNKIPGVYNNSETINWWGRGGNFFGLTVAYEDTMMTITSMEVTHGYYMPTAKTVRGQEAKICYVAMNSSFQYAYNTTDRTQQVMTASMYEDFFLKYSSTECNFAATSDPFTAATFKNIWKYAKRIYNAMSTEEKAALVTSTGEGMQRYDYLVAKYSLENFINRAQPSNSSLEVVNNSNVNIVIIAISLIAITGIFAFVSYKRKEQRQ